MLRFYGVEVLEFMISGIDARNSDHGVVADLFMLGIVKNNVFAWNKERSHIVTF